MSLSCSEAGPDLHIYVEHWLCNLRGHNDNCDGNLTIRYKSSPHSSLNPPAPSPSLQPSEQTPAQTAREQTLTRYQSEIILGWTMGVLLRHQSHAKWTMNNICRGG